MGLDVGDFVFEVLELVLEFFVFLEFFGSFGGGILAIGGFGGHVGPDFEVFLLVLGGEVLGIEVLVLLVELHGTLHDLDGLGMGAGRVGTSLVLRLRPFLDLVRVAVAEILLRQGPSDLVHELNGKKLKINYSNILHVKVHHFQGH